MINLEYASIRSGFFFPIPARQGQGIFADHQESVESFSPVTNALDCEISRYVDTSTIDDRPNVTRISINPDYYISFLGGDVTDIWPQSGDVPMRQVFELHQEVVCLPSHLAGVEATNENMSGLKMQEQLHEFGLNHSPSIDAGGLQKDGFFVRFSVRPNTGPIDIVSWGFDGHDKRTEKIYARAKNGKAWRLLGSAYKYFRIDRATLERFYTPDNPPLRNAQIFSFPTKFDNSTP